MDYDPRISPIDKKTIQQELKNNLSIQSLLQSQHTQFNIIPLDSENGYVSCSFILQKSDGALFFKCRKDQNAINLYTAERDGLERLRKLRIDGVRVPKFIGVGSLSIGGAYIILEYIEMIPLEDMTKLSRVIADLHDIRNDKFGGNNVYVGIQNINTSYSNNWTQFFVNQLYLPAVKNLYDIQGMGYIVYNALQVFNHINDILGDIEGIVPRLIHGDLVPNYRQDYEGNIVLFDGTPFFAHHELEFAAFKESRAYNRFLHMYQERHPFRVGHRKRKVLYALYINLTLLRYRQNAYFKKKCTHCFKQLLDHVMPSIVDSYVDLDKVIERKAEGNAIVVLQGTLNPPHYNHLSILKTACHILRTKYNKNILKGYLAPIPDVYAKKKLKQEALPLNDRVALCRILARNEEDIDVHPGGKKTVALLQELETVYEHTLSVPCEVIVLYGYDNYKEMNRIPHAYSIGIIKRHGYDIDMASLGKRECIYHIPEWEGPDLSSTHMRQLLLDGDTGGLEAYMPREGLAYLKDIGYLQGC